MLSRWPPQLFFLASALFHYLGPAFAVLLFARLRPLGVAWLRIATAAILFVAWRPPWRTGALREAKSRRTVFALGAVLALMNACFYEAIARLPLGTVGAIEFVGPIALAAAGLRTPRNLIALALAAAGVYALTDIRIVRAPAGYLFAFANCALFTLYVVLGHRIASAGSGIDRLGAAMAVATVVALPLGIADAFPALGEPPLLAAAAGVGISSSVIPYVCDQLAMERLPRASFALLLSLLPATAAAIGVLILHQMPSLADLLGLALVAAGVALHRFEEGA